MVNPMTEVQELLEIIETARETGKVKKGVNEATKAAERGVAKLIVVAEDVDPPEIVMHFQPLCEEKNIILKKVPSKLELGRAAGLDVATATVAVVEPGDAKKKLDTLRE